MVKETFEWILESLENDKELKVIVEADAFSEFFGYLYVKHYKLPYLNVLYLYEFAGSTSDGSYLSIYNIYVIITSDYIPNIKDDDLSYEEKEALLNFIKSRISEE